MQLYHTFFIKFVSLFNLSTEKHFCASSKPKISKKTLDVRRIQSQSKMEPSMREIISDDWNLYKRYVWDIKTALWIQLSIYLRSK